MKNPKTIAELEELSIRVYEETLKEYSSRPTFHTTDDLVGVAAIEVMDLLDIPRFVFECEDFLNFEIDEMALSDYIGENFRKTISVEQILYMALRSIVFMAITRHIEQTKERISFRAYR